MARLSWIAVLTLLVVLAAPAAARACSCLPAPPPAEAAERADFVFAGTVTAIRRIEHSSKDPQRDQLAYTFEVSQTMKGNVASPFEVLSAASGALCGRSFAQGQAYLVYARSKDGQAHDNLCSRTRRLEDASEDLEHFGTNKADDASAGGGGGEAAPPAEPPRAEPAVPAVDEPPPVAGQCRACSCSVPAHLPEGSTVWLTVLVALALRRRGTA